MAMNGNTMGSAVVTALTAVDPSLTTAQKAQLTSAWQAICTAIVTHIQTNAIVTVTSVSGVQTGSGVSGPGAGTVS